MNLTPPCLSGVTAMETTSHNLHRHAELQEVLTLQAGSFAIAGWIITFVYSSKYDISKVYFPKDTVGN